MSNVLKHFSDDYSQARARFSRAATQAGAKLAVIPHPLTGRKGEDLGMDVAWLGPQDAEKALVVLSGTHGIEGYCGSGIQTTWLTSSQVNARADDTAVMLVHAVNPYGFSWERRVNEDNIDLNRNYVDFTKPLPQNRDYAKLHAALCPKTWNMKTQDQTQKAIDAYVAEHGNAAMQQAVTGGQYEFADGLFYGGTAPSWSRRTLLKLLSQRLAKVKVAAVIDLHTGLGPPGYGERICDHPKETKEREWTNQIYRGDLTCFSDGTSVSSNIQGDTLMGITQALPHLLISAVALEFGTVVRAEVRQAVRADNWLHLYGQIDSAQGRTIKDQIRAAFYPKSQDWCRAVTERGFESFDLALASLSGV